MRAKSSIRGFRSCVILCAVALGLARPARAESDPMLAGAAFARSDLSPLSGVTVLRFVPGYGLQRYPLGQSPSPLDQNADAPIRSTDPARSPGSADQHWVWADGAIHDKPIAARIRDAVSQALDIGTPKSKRLYVFVATGDRQLGLNFGGAGLLNVAGLSIEHSQIRSNARAGLGWQDDAYTTLLSFSRSKPRVRVPWLPAAKDDRVALTLLRADR